MINSTYNSSITLHTTVYSSNNPIDNSFRILNAFARERINPIQRMNASDVHTYDFRGRLQIRSCLVARYTMTQSLGQSDYDRFTREYPQTNVERGSFPWGCVRTKWNETRLSLIFDCGTTPRTNLRLGIRWRGTSPNEGWGRDQCPEDATPNGRTEEGRLGCSFLSCLATIAAMIESWSLGSLLAAHTVEYFIMRNVVKFYFTNCDYDT